VGQWEKEILHKFQTLERSTASTIDELKQHINTMQ
jgi:hypothetical protein